MRTANDMNDEPYKGLAALLGVLSPEQEKIEQDKARREVGRKLGVIIPSPDEISASESRNDSSDYLSPSLTYTETKIFQPEEIRDKFGHTKAEKNKMINDWYVRKPSKKKIDFKLKEAAVQSASPKQEYKYPVKKYDSIDPSTYPSDPQQRLALAHGTATDQINAHHQDNQGKLLSKEESRKTLQYVSDSATRHDGARKANWIFNPVTGDLEDSNDPDWIKKSESRMNQFHDTKVDPITGHAEPKIGTDAHKEKYPERYKTGYVSRSERIVNQLKELKEFGKNKLVK